jgi:PAS domain S-box-containing protein
MVEDSPDDAELIELELTNGGYQIEALRVVSAADMATALSSADWDVIIADYSVPGFGAVPSLKLLRESGRDIPFIIVTGSISDEMAVASMRAGAHDYVLKDNLLRLVPAVEREIKESAARHQKHEAEAALHESQSRLKGIVQSAMDSIISVDEEQRIVLFNEAAERLFGCPSSEALGSSLDRFIPPKFRDVHRDHIRTFGMSGMTTRSMYSPGVLTALRTSGEEFPIEATISQIEAAGRKYFTVILRDISERKRAEEENSRLQAQLAQSQKLEAIGQLAGGVAHDFNTLLNIILGYSDLLLADLPEGDPRRERVKQIQTSGETGALLTKQLLAFSRRRALVPQVIDLSTTVGDLEPMLRRLLREDIELEVHRAEQACPVKVDPGQIQQLVLNLAANARDAMPRGGNLTIEVRTVELDESYVHQHPSMTPGQYEMLAVSDTGVGMDSNPRNSPEVKRYCSSKTPNLCASLLGSF